MKKIIGIIGLLLIMMSFVGTSAAATTTTTMSSWQSDYNPYIGKTMSKSSETYTYKSSTYSSITQMTMVGKAVKITSSKISVKCIEKTVTTSWDPYTGKHVKTSYRTYLNTIYRF